MKEPGKGAGVRGSLLEERLEGKDVRRNGERGSARLGSRAPPESAREQTATHGPDLLQTRPVDAPGSSVP